MQRNFRIFDNMDVEAKEASADSRGLRVTWKSPRSPASDKHESFFEWDFIERYLTSRQRAPANYRYVQSSGAWE